MEARKLEALITSVELGSFNKAAKVLGYTQSGLTHMMNALERELGFSVLERNNYGVQQELKVLRTAKELGFYTFGLAYDEEIAMQIAADNHDALVLVLAMVEWEKGGATLEEAADYVNRITTKVKAVAPEILVFVQGVPVVTPEDTQYMYDHTDAVGFVGINNMEFGEEPIQDTVAAFKSAKIHR